VCANAAHTTWQTQPSDVVIEMSEHGTSAVEGRPEPLTDLADSRVWSMLESAPDGMILTDEHGAILIVNRQIEVLFGYDRVELLGTPIETLIPRRFRALHQTHRSTYKDTPTVRPMGEPFDLLGRRKDGSEFPVEVSLSPIEDAEGSATIASIRDVTDRVQSDRRLEASEQAFRTTFESAPAGMATVYVDGQGERIVERVNRSFCDMLQCEPGDLIGTDLGTLTHPDDDAADRVTAAEMVGGLRAGYDREKRYRRADGTYVWALLHSTVLGRGEKVLVLCHAVDLTERRAMQAERARNALLEDRERIGRDLHDVVIQRLFAAGMGLQSVVPQVSPDDAVVRIQSTIDELDATIRELRSTIFGLSTTGASESIADQLEHAVAVHDRAL
jgi:PAS domain S-box-containing protein